MQNWRLQQTFYGIVLASVMGLALAGGYLFWRDIQRELRLAELRSQFVASVSHELKTPLTAIRMFAETLQLDRMPDLETRRQYLDTIVNESERLTRLINNVLDVSKIERGEKVYRLEPAPLAPVVRDAVTAMHYPLVRMGFDLRADLREDVPDVRIDPDGIRQAVLNLLSNAIKYSAERRHVDVTLQRVNGDAIIAVTDYGIGIPLGEQRRIFDRFYRAPVSENERIPGTGLGLALVQHIVRAHHGRIEVRSAPGEGSTFAIHLPFSTEAPDRQGHT
jgi:signal transduction histidine kinase